MNEYEAYLKLLTDAGKILSQLTDVAHQKTAAVRADDLAALDACIKQEQALSLSLRGQEQKRTAALAALGLESTSLAQFPDHCPAGLRQQAVKTCQSLREQYDIYRSAAEVARSTLECNLHQIEQFLAQSRGEDPAAMQQKGAPEPPPAMKTDFRA